MALAIPFHTFEYMLGSIDGCMDGGSLAFSLSVYLPAMVSERILSFAALERIFV